MCVCVCVRCACMRVCVRVCVWVCTIFHWPVLCSNFYSFKNKVKHYHIQRKDQSAVTFGGQDFANLVKFVEVCCQFCWCHYRSFSLPCICCFQDTNSLFQIWTSCTIPHNTCLLLPTYSSATYGNHPPFYLLTNFYNSIDTLPSVKIFGEINK